MYKILSQCPVCSNNLKAIKLKCTRCNTAIENEFSLSKFDYLNSQQLYFIETFIKCRGSIKDVEKELGISYPTVRAKLDEVILALGYDVVKETQSKKERTEILEALEKGEISAEEALKILNETEYSNILSKAKRVNDYENILSYELKRVYELMYELCPVKDVVDLMSVKYRYHNLKVLLKGKFLSKDLSNLLIDLGIEDLKELKSIIDKIKPDKVVVSRIDNEIFKNKIGISYEELQKISKEVLSYK